MNVQALLEERLLPRIEGSIRKKAKERINEAIDLLETAGILIKVSDSMGVKPKEGDGFSSALRDRLMEMCEPAIKADALEELERAIITAVADRSPHTNGLRP